MALWLLIRIRAEFLGYISSRGRGKWYGNLTEQLVFVPYLMSGVAFSTMYFSMFSVPHFGGLIPSLYGTFTLIRWVTNSFRCRRRRPCWRRCSRTG